MNGQHFRFGISPVEINGLYGTPIISSGLLTSNYEIRARNPRSEGSSLREAPNQRMKVSTAHKLRNGQINLDY